MAFVVCPGCGTPHGGAYCEVPIVFEDPHGWVSVDDRMPEVGMVREVENGTACRWQASWDGAAWIADQTRILGVTHWRIPTPGPSEGGAS